MERSKKPTLGHFLVNTLKLLWSRVRGNVPSNQGKKVKSTSLLDQEIISFGKAGGLDLNTTLKGTFCVGSSGSGKTSATNFRYATNFLKFGMGGLVPAIKNDVREEWEGYMKEVGRPLEDLVVVSPDCNHRFNILEYELAHSEGGGQTMNIVDMLITIAEMSESEKSSNTDTEKFFTQSTRSWLTHSINTLRLADEKLSLDNIDRIIMDMPNSSAEIADEGWQNSSYCFECLNIIRKKKDKTAEEVKKHNKLVDFFFEEIAEMDGRLRSNILATYKSTFSYFHDGILRDLFCTDTNITPDDTFLESKVILVDIPVLDFQKVGLLANVVWKYVFQKAVERRRMTENSKPVFLVVDEAQYVIHERDLLFLSTCRGKYCNTLYLTQSVSAVYSKFSANSKDKGEELLTNFATKIFHSNSSFTTREWASKLIGSTWSSRSNMHVRRGSQSASMGESESILPQVPEHSFSLLKTGGKENDYIVECYVTVAGKKWPANGNKNYLKVAFKQNVKH